MEVRNKLILTTALSLGPAQLLAPALVFEILALKIFKKQAANIIRKNSIAKPLMEVNQDDIEKLPDASQKKIKKIINRSEKVYSLVSIHIKLLVPIVGPKILKAEYNKKLI